MTVRATIAASPTLVEYRRRRVGCPPALARRQGAGLAVDLFGRLAYLMAWVAMVYFPASVCGASLAGSTAIAWTSLLRLVGIGLIGDSLYLPIPYRAWVYISLAVVFAAFHTLHAVIVYLRLL